MKPTDLMASRRGFLLGAGAVASSERPEVVEAFDHARKVYDVIVGECKES